MLRELVEQKYVELQEKLYLKKCARLDKQATKVSEAVRRILGEDVSAVPDYESGAVTIDGYEFTLTDGTLTGIIKCSDKDCRTTLCRYLILDTADFYEFMQMGDGAKCKTHESKFSLRLWWGK